MLTHADSPPRLAEIANTHKLDAAVLGRWITHLAAVEHDDNDPLHAWAKVAGSLVPANRRRKPPGVAAGDNHPAAYAAGSPNSKSGTQVIIDYAQCKSDDWFTNGFAFGPG